MTETGSSLRANNLRIVDEIIQSTPRLIANHKAYADAEKKQIIDDLALMLSGAMAAEGKVGLMMNVPRESLQKVLSLLPALQQPTVSDLADKAGSRQHDSRGIGRAADHSPPESGRSARDRRVSAHESDRLKAEISNAECRKSELGKNFQ